MDVLQAFVPAARRWLARRATRDALVLAGTQCPGCGGTKISGEPLCEQCAIVEQCAP